MGLFSNRIDPSLLQPGDHVYSYRNKHIYSHHGIYVGDNKVIHFTRTHDDEKNQDLMVRSCKECGYKPNRGGVVKCCLDCFLKGHRLFRFKYGISSSRFVMNRSGTCSTATCYYAPDDVVRRATEMLHSTEGFGEYNLLHNNCESFAVYCKTGKRLSLQAFSFINVKTSFEELSRQPFPVKYGAKTVFKVVVKHKMDILRHDIAVHQQDKEPDKDY